LLTSPSASFISAKAGTTALFDLECLPATGDVDTLSTRFYDTTPFGAPPAWDGTDAFPVAPELLTVPTDPTTAALAFPASSVLADTFDSGTPVTLRITNRIQGNSTSAQLDLVINAAHVRMTFAADHATATGGMIGGVIKTEDLVAEMKKFGALVGVCGPLFDNLITSIRQASDILVDGTQDPTKTCDGISIGLGFDAVAANVGSVGPTEPASDTCP
jgi:hypothetical protein